MLKIIVCVLIGVLNAKIFKKEQSVESFLVGLALTFLMTVAAVFLIELLALE